MKALDPVTLAVLNGRLVQIADEMDATLFRSAFNPIIAEAHDACHGLYHAETGATLVQGTSGLPIFVGAMAFAVKAVIDNQELDSRNSTGAIYWEGLSDLLDSNGKHVGRGYLEMTGYAQRLRM